MQTICSIPVDQVGRGLLFATLTYPGNYPGDWQVWKRHLHTWTKRLRRRLPGAGLVWKLEPQKRGAPHFHLLIVGVPYLAKDWLSRSWYEVVGSGDPRHLAAGTQVQLARSHRGVVSYAAKYTAKHQELPADWQDGVGRWWGVFNAPALGIVIAWWYLSEREFWAASRVLHKILARRETSRPRGPPKYRPGGFWLVLPHAEATRLLLWLGTLRLRQDLLVSRAWAGIRHPQGRSGAKERAAACLTYARPGATHDAVLAKQPRGATSASQLCIDPVVTQA